MKQETLNRALKTDPGSITGRSVVSDKQREREDSKGSNPQQPSDKDIKKLFVPKKRIMMDYTSMFHFC